VGVLVDRLRGQQEVVIKALDDYLGETSGVAGATILGDGSVVLIVDTTTIF
jgi:two-component system chemotaxis sensor kinase CheA